MADTTQDPDFLAAVQLARVDALARHESVTAPMTEGERNAFRAGYLSGALEGIAIAQRAFSELKS